MERGPPWSSKGIPVQPPCTLLLGHGGVCWSQPDLGLNPPLHWSHIVPSVHCAPASLASCLPISTASCPASGPWNRLSPLPRNPAPTAPAIPTPELTVLALLSTPLSSLPRIYHSWKWFCVRVHCSPSHPATRMHSPREEGPCVLLTAVPPEQGLPLDPCEHMQAPWGEGPDLSKLSEPALLPLSNGHN